MKNKKSVGVCMNCIELAVYGPLAIIKKVISYISYTKDNQEFSEKLEENN